jgi:hypothetical protein
MFRNLLRKLTAKISIFAFITIFGFQGLALAGPASAECVSVVVLDNTEATDGFYETCGGDDRSYRIPISGDVIFGGISYSNIYATTNSVITFGQKDGTYDEFPSTPSISLDSFDWVARGFFGNDGSQSSVTDDIGLLSTWTPRADEYFNITVQGNSFRVDLAARAYAYNRTSDQDYINSMRANAPIGSPVQMSIYFVRNEDGTLRIRSFTSNSTDSGLRNGCVLTEGGTPITLEECGIFEVTSLEILEATNIPLDYLVVISPVQVEESADSVICKSAKLQYMVQGTSAQTAKLESQTYAIELNGTVVAQTSTLASSASFAKSSIPGSGVVTCVQTARQGDASMTIGSANHQATSSASALRDSAIAAAKKAYYETLQKLGQEKLDQLRLSSSSDSSVDYKSAVEKWRLQVLDAQAVRDAAIEAAITADVKNLSTIGAQVTITK